MLLEYLMMMLFLFGLTTVERNGSNAFALETTTTHPPHHHQRTVAEVESEADPLAKEMAAATTTHQQHVPPSLSLSSTSSLSSQSAVSHHRHHQQQNLELELEQELEMEHKRERELVRKLEEHELSSNFINDSIANAEPQFENATEREVIAAVGTTARLHCRVRNLGDRAVSWIRKRDLHILTIGIMTYTNDQRFLARHIDNSDEWVLKIVSVQLRDAGIYECQVSTEPKISQAYKLTVVTSRAQILANRELFIQSGSDINLTCIAPQAPGPYTHMLWYKDSELINDSPRGGIRVVSEQQMKTSNVVISRVLSTDSGNYTCAAENSNSDSVFVHIIKSEQHAAMQHELAVSIQAPKMLLVLLVFFYMLEFVIK